MRYDKLKEAGCRNIKEYNTKFINRRLNPNEHDFMPYIVLVIDELADLMMVVGKKIEELIARLRALIRRASGNTSSELTAGDVRLDTRSGRVTLDGEPVKLTAQEYKLLSYLMHHKGKVVSRTELVEHLYDQDFDRDSNTVEVFVGRLRKKLGVDVLHTIRGMGYTVTEPDNAA